MCASFMKFDFCGMSRSLFSVAAAKSYGFKIQTEISLFLARCTQQKHHLHYRPKKSPKVKLIRQQHPPRDSLRRLTNKVHCDECALFCKNVVGYLAFRNRDRPNILIYEKFDPSDQHLSSTHYWQLQYHQDSFVYKINDFPSSV